MIHHQKY